MSRPSSFQEDIGLRKRFDRMLRPHLPFEYLVDKAGPVIESLLWEIGFNFFFLCGWNKGVVTKGLASAAIRASGADIGTVREAKSTPTKHPRVVYE